MNPHTTTGTPGWAIRVTTNGHSHYTTPHGPVAALEEATSFTHDYAAAMANRVETGTIDLIPTSRDADTGWAVRVTTGAGTNYVAIGGNVATLAAAASMTRELAEAVFAGITHLPGATAELLPTSRVIDTPTPNPTTTANDPV